MAWLNSQIFIGTVCSLLSIPAFSNEIQSLNEGFETSHLPEHWHASGAVTIDSNIGHEPSTKSVQLSRVGTYVESPAVSNVGTINFFLRAPSTSDAATIVLEVSADEGQTWKTLLSEDLSTSQLQGSSRFFERTADVNIADAVRFRWRLSSYSSGFAQIDDVRTTPLSVEQRLRIANENQLRVIDEKFKQAQANFIATNYESAKSQFSASQTSFTEQFNKLARAYRRSTQIDIIVTTAKVAATRSAMANPLSYKTFKQVCSDLEQILPDVKKSRLAEIVESFTGLLSGVGRVVMSFAPGFHSIVEGFKGLITDGYSPSNLDSKFPSLLGHSDNYKKYVKDGPAVYANLKGFLASIVADAEQVGRLNAELSNASTLSVGFQADLRDALERQLAACKITNINWNELGNDAETERNRIRSEIARCVESSLGTRDSFKSLTADQSSMLQRLNSDYSSSSEEKYRTLYAAVNNFYTNLITNLKGQNPFEGVDSDAAAHWKKQRDLILPDAIAAADKFKSTYAP